MINRKGTRMEKIDTDYKWRIWKIEAKLYNRGIHADVIVYIFAHLHTTLRTDFTEGNMLDTNWLLCWVVRKPVNANPGFKVNRGNNFSSLKMLYTPYMHVCFA